MFSIKLPVLMLEASSNRRNVVAGTAVGVGVGVGIVTA